MPVVLWSSPGAAPEVSTDNWQGFSFVWTSHLGVQIDLRDPENGRFLLASGVLGLHHPLFETFTSRSPNSSISRLKGTRSGPREIELPMHLYSSHDSDEFLRRDLTFWELFSPEQYGTLTVQPPNRVPRSIQARLTSGGDFVYDRDPAKAGWSTYPLTLIADDPFWHGAPQTRSWDNADPVEFFDPAGSPPFTIASGAELSSARLNNFGDVPVWVKWTIAGPMDSLTITVDGGDLGIPPLEETDTLVIDTDPRVGTAILNGTDDISGEIDPWDPRPIPAHSNSEISLVMTGTGAVTGDFTPRFFRAFN